MNINDSALIQAGIRLTLVGLVFPGIYFLNRAFFHSDGMGAYANFMVGVICFIAFALVFIPYVFWFPNHGWVRWGVTLAVLFLGLSAAGVYLNPSEFWDVRSWFLPVVVGPCVTLFGLIRIVLKG